MKTDTFTWKDVIFNHSSISKMLNHDNLYFNEDTRFECVRRIYGARFNLKRLRRCKDEVERIFRTKLYGAR